MFVIVRTERPRDEVAPLILLKISAATGGIITALSFKNAERIRKSCYFIALTNGLEIDV